MVGLWAIERVYISLCPFLCADVLILFDQSEMRFHQLAPRVDHCWYWYFESLFLPAGRWWKCAVDQFYLWEYDEKLQASLFAIKAMVPYGQPCDLLTHTHDERTQTRPLS